MSGVPCSIVVSTPSWDKNKMFSIIQVVQVVITLLDHLLVLLAQEAGVRDYHGGVRGGLQEGLLHGGAQVTPARGSVELGGYGGYGRKRAVSRPS